MDHPRQSGGAAQKLLACAYEITSERERAVLRAEGLPLSQETYESIHSNDAVDLSNVFVCIGQCRRFDL
jgi:hypothetical protein